MDTLKILIAGLGTVGGGVVEILKKNKTIFEQKLKKKIKIVGVASRRKVNISSQYYFKDAIEILNFEDYDILIETIGGSDGVAKKIIFDALKKGKNIITANKALLSKHGHEIAKLAEKNNCFIGYEAAIAGGIPLVCILKNFLASNSVKKVYGILNGTSNFILSKMLETKQDFAKILEDAKNLGYAESDPTFDINGLDTAHKLSIITSIAFSRKIDFSSIYVAGIENVELTDLEFAEILGYKIKLIGLTQNVHSKIQQFVYPCLIDKRSEIANVNNVLNGIIIESDSDGRIFLQGEGAGALPTATSILSDLEKISNQIHSSLFGVCSNKLVNSTAFKIDDREGSFYLRFITIDKPGVIADISKEFKKNKISMKSMLQKDPKNKKIKLANIVVTTHACKEKSMRKALKTIDKLSVIKKKTVIYRIENL